MNYPQHCVQIRDPSQPSQARRIAQSLAEELEFNETRRGEAGIIVTEAARNVYLHGGGGEVLLRAWKDREGSGLDMLALDNGPGMQDVAQCLRDGYSTAGTPGTGLGALVRLSAIFDIWSAQGQGTALFARIAGQLNSEVRDFVTGAISLPMNEGTECGDAWAEHHFPGRSVYVVADGLGHGKAAAEAAQEAVQVFHRFPDLSPEKLMQRMHDALKKTRGAAVAAAEIDTERAVVRYAGVGNIFSSVMTDSASRSMVSHNGTLGHHLTRVQEFSYPWTQQSTLLMQSDGLTARWDLRRYPGLVLRDPRLIAGVLYRDWKRGRDDATILVARQSKK